MNAMSHPHTHFQIGELVEAATYVQNDGWHWLGRKMIVTEDDGGPLVKGNVQTPQGEYWEYFRREHVRTRRRKSGLKMNSSKPSIRSVLTFAALHCAPLTQGQGNPAARAPRGQSLTRFSNENEPFQDSYGSWYIQKKGTIRRLSAPQTL